MIHLASDHPEVVLEAEKALFGEVTEPNDVEMEATLTGIFDRVSPLRIGGQIRMLNRQSPNQNRRSNPASASLPHLRR